MRKPTFLLFVAGAAALLARVARLDAVRVHGQSMSPTLRAGDLILLRTMRAGEPRVGQIVVAHVGDREVVKRVTVAPRSIAADEVWLEGDNEARSTDSRTTGPVPKDAVVGIVRARYWPPRAIRGF